MGKYKLAREKKTGLPPKTRAAIPCLVLIVLGFVLVAVVFYYGMKAS